MRGWCVVGPRYKYVLYQWGRNREALYDLQDDPGEMVNLAVDRRYEAELNRLRRAMYDRGVRIGDPKLVRNLRPPGRIPELKPKTDPIYEKPRFRAVRCALRRRAADAGSPRGECREAHRRPNIIVMMTDDHTTQAMSCYGSLLVETPNLDRLAREGMLFENCYVSNAISGTLAGLHPHGQVQPRKRIHGQFAHFRRRPADLPS